LIVHGHIAIAGKRITSPSYIVPRNKENLIGFYYKSPLAHKAIALQEEGS